MRLQPAQPDGAGDRRVRGDRAVHRPVLLGADQHRRAEGLGIGVRPSLVEATRLAGTEVAFDVRGELSAVPPVVSREVYRILQECLTNAVRHAGKVPVSVAVAVAARELVATVANPLGDAGSGRASGGRGLRGMTERASALGGELSAGRVDERWEVVVRVPWGSGR